MKIKFVLFERTLERNSIYSFSISLFVLEILLIKILGGSREDIQYDKII